MSRGSPDLLDEDGRDTREDLLAAIGADFKVFEGVDFEGPVSLHSTYALGDPEGRYSSLILGEAPTASGLESLKVTNITPRRSHRKRRPDTDPMPEPAQPEDEEKRPQRPRRKRRHDTDPMPAPDQSKAEAEIVSTTRQEITTDLRNGKEKENPRDKMTCFNKVIENSLCLKCAKENKFSDTDAENYADACVSKGKLLDSPQEKRILFTLAITELRDKGLNSTLLANAHFLLGENLEGEARLLNYHEAIKIIRSKDIDPEGRIILAQAYIGSALLEPLRAQEYYVGTIDLLKEPIDGISAPQRLSLLSSAYALCSNKIEGNREEKSKLCHAGIMTLKDKEAVEPLNLKDYETLALLKKVFLETASAESVSKLTAPRNFTDMVDASRAKLGTSLCP